MTTTITQSLPRLSDGVEAELACALPEGICRTFRVQPYAFHEGHVLVAAADADDELTEHVVAERLDAPVLLVRHTVKEILEVVGELHPTPAEDCESAEARRARLQVADLLLDHDLVTPRQLEHAMVEYSRTGDPIGDILAAHEAVSEDVLVAVLSQVHQLQRVTLADYEPDPALARRLPEPVARGLRALPLAEADGEVLLAVARPLEAEATALVESAVGRPVRQLLAHRGDLDQLIQRIHAAQYVDVATRFLMEDQPGQSAHVVVSSAQKAAFVLAATAVATGLVLAPTGTATVLVGLCTVLYVAVAAHRLRLGLRTLGARPHPGTAEADLAALDERHLPTYTVLVPLYREAALVPRLVRALDDLDYPRTRLDVKLLCEEDDLETIETVRALALPPHLHLVVVPDSHPKTRPKACNYGLQLATGTYCVVLDAHDRPDPDQLKRSLLAFAQAPDDVVALQAGIRVDDPEQNLLTAWSAAEHAMHHELLVPAMSAAETPLPLGASSTHFEVRALREVGAWDPFNVTQDVDLGMRLHREGHRAAVLDSTTTAEAASTTGAWLRQRSRWAKGHTQTWLVHMRHPLQLARQIGPRAFVSFNLTMGAVLVLLLNPVLWALLAVQGFSRWVALGPVLPAPVVQAAALMLLVGHAILIQLTLAGTLRRGEFRLARAALLSPLSWALMSWAAWRGVSQLRTDPFSWEKPQHAPRRVRP